MSAPKNAITLQHEVETEWLKGVGNEDARDMLQASVSCPCGFQGKLGDLLCDPDDPNPPANDFWCPNCRLKGWSFFHNPKAQR